MAPDRFGRRTSGRPPPTPDDRSATIPIAHEPGPPLISRRAQRRGERPSPFSRTDGRVVADASPKHQNASGPGAAAVSEWKGNRTRVRDAETGEQEVRGHGRVVTRFRSHAGIRPHDVVAACVRKGPRVAVDGEHRSGLLGGAAVVTAFLCIAAASVAGSSVAPAAQMQQRRQERCNSINGHSRLAR